MVKVPIYEWDEWVKATRKLSIDEFITTVTRYRYRGRWISKEEADRLLKQRKPVRVETYHITKKAIRELGLKPREWLKPFDEKVGEIKLYIKRENEIRGLMRKQYISREEAEERFRRAYEVYERNREPREFKEIIGSP